MIINIYCGWEPIVEQCETDKVPDVGAQIDVDGDSFLVLSVVPHLSVSRPDIYEVHVKPCSSNST